MKSQRPLPALICETSWEVCNKIGGIYTVLTTKAKTLQSEYKDKVVFIGPDLCQGDSHPRLFMPSKTLLKEWKNSANLPFGITVKVGKWKIPGRPIAILVSFYGLYSVKNDFYAEMWNNFGVDSLHAYGDYDEGCAFGLASAIVIESLANFLAPDKPVVAQFNEWTTSMGLLYLKLKAPRIATVFTTHATCIGRSICGNGKPLYDYLPGYNGDQMARELNMESKHSLEKAAAREADCFTTVSDVTAAEANQLLEKMPEVTPNGFEIDFVPKGEKYKAARENARKAIVRVASALTGKTYDKEPFLIATSGRMEYRNKGIDMFLDVLGNLSKEKTSRPVIACILVPAWAKGPREDLQQRLNEGSAHTSSLPDPVSTHDLYNPNEDAILSRIHSLDLDNGESKDIDVIYVPTYLKGQDGIFDLGYYELLPAFDATVFPSYYEPWGYTPLESVAFGIPTITTSLSGFGRWVEKNFDNTFMGCGVNVIFRNDSNYHEAVHEIISSLRFLAHQDAGALKHISHAARMVAAEAQWKNFIKYYNEAFGIAIANAEKRIKH